MSAGFSAGENTGVSFRNPSPPQSFLLYFAPDRFERNKLNARQISCSKPARLINSGRSGKNHRKARPGLLSAQIRRRHFPVKVAYRPVVGYG